MKKISAILLIMILIGVFGSFGMREADAAPAPYFKLVASQGQGGGSNTFYVGRCVRVDIYLNTSIFNTNGADVEINYDNTNAQVVQSNCSTAATTIYSDALFNAYPGAGNSVTLSKIYLSAYNNPGVSTNTSYGLYGHFFLLVSAESADYDLTFQYTPESTIDTNLAETGGDGSDILASVENLELIFASDGDSPDITGQSPASGATSVYVSSTVSFNADDAMGGVNSSTITARMKEAGGSYYSQTVSAGTVLSTNQNRYYQYPVTFSPNSSVKTNSGYYAYNTVYTVEAAASDLASPAHAVTESWSFTTEDDSAAPYLSDIFPANSATGVSVSANISFRVKDYKSNGGVIPGLGVSTAAISVQVSSPSLGSETYTCSSGVVACDDADVNNVLVTINPPVNFAEDETVTVQVDAGDLHAPANSMATQSFSFSTADTGLPAISSLSPANNSYGNAVGTNVSFHLVDTGAGVDISSLQVYLNDTSYTADSQALAFTGDSSNYLITINPAGDFTDNTAVVVRVSVRDQASVPNYILPNPYTYSFIVGLSSTGGRVWTADLCPTSSTCPACPAQTTCSACAPCPAATKCPDAVATSVCKCPAVSTYSVGASIQVKDNNTKNNCPLIIVPSKPAVCATSTEAPKQEASVGKKDVPNPALTEPMPHQSVALYVKLHEINQKKYDGRLIKIEQTPELAIAGVTNLPKDEIIPLIISSVGEFSEQVFYAVVGEGGFFNIKMKNLFTGGTYEIKAALAAGNTEIEQINLGSFLINTQEVAVLAETVAPGKSADYYQNFLLIVLISVLICTSVVLLLKKSVEAIIGIGCIVVLSIIGMIVISVKLPAEEMDRVLSAEQTQFIATQDSLRAEYAAAAAHAEKALPEFQGAIIDPLAKSPIAGVVVSKQGKSVIVDKNGSFTLAAGGSNEKVEFYFPSMRQTATAPFASLRSDKLLVSPSLLPIMAAIGNDYAQNKYRKVYAYWHKQAKQTIAEETFIHNENAKFLARIAKYDIISQEFEPFIESASLFEATDGKVYHDVFAARYVFSGLDSDGHAISFSEPWYFVQEGGAWRVMRRSGQ